MEDPGYFKKYVCNFGGVGEYFFCPQGVGGAIHGVDADVNKI